MKPKLLATLLLAWFGSISAQDIYVVNNANDLKVVNTQTFEVTDLFNIPTSVTGIMTDLAFAPDGTLYAVTETKKLVEIDLQNQSYSIIFDLFLGDTYTGLVCNANNELFFNRYITQKLYKYNIDTGTSELVEDNISTPGDFTFYKGNLIYPNFFDDFIRAYDGNQVFNIGCAVTQLWTFVNVFEDCDTNTIYAIDQLSRVYLYDLETENYEMVAELFSETGQIYGGATTTEYLASACPLESLEEVTCTILGSFNYDISSLSIIPNPASGAIRIDGAEQFSELRYSIFDLYGKSIISNKEYDRSISLDLFSPGVYIIEIWSPEFGSRIWKKLIVE